MPLPNGTFALRARDIIRVPIADIVEQLIVEYDDSHEITPSTTTLCARHGIALHGNAWGTCKRCERELLEQTELGI